MRPSHMWIDEAWFAQAHTPPPMATLMDRVRYWEPPANGRSISMETESIAWEKQRRAHQELKNRRRKEMENCLHGQRLFPIGWRAGVHPSGERIFYANVDGLRGGPYLLNEMQHQVLHDEGHGHEHVSERFK